MQEYTPPSLPRLGCWSLCPYSQIQRFENSSRRRSFFCVVYCFSCSPERNCPVICFISGFLQLAILVVCVSLKYFPTLCRHCWSLWWFSHFDWHPKQPSGRATDVVRLRFRRQTPIQISAAGTLMLKMQTERFTDSQMYLQSVAMLFEREYDSNANPVRLNCQVPH